MEDEPLHTSLRRALIPRFVSKPARDYSYNGLVSPLDHFPMRESSLVWVDVPAQSWGIYYGYTGNAQVLIPGSYSLSSEDARGSSIQYVDGRVHTMQICSLQCLCHNHQCVVLSAALVYEVTDPLIVSTQPHPILDLQNQASGLIKSVVAGLPLPLSLTSVENRVLPLLNCRAQQLGLYVFDMALSYTMGEEL